MEWYYYLIIIFILFVVGLFISAFIAFKLFFCRGYEREFINVDLSQTLYAKHEEWIKESYSFLQSLPSEDVYMMSRDKLKLKGLYIDNKSEKTIFFIHGYHSTPFNHFACVGRRMYELGYNLFFIDQRAHLQSEGKYPTFGIKERLDVVDWAHFINKHYNPKHIILYGLSMGCASAEMAISLDIPNNVRCAILDCGFKSPFSLMVYQTKKRVKFLATIGVLVMNIYCKLIGGFSLFESSSEKSLRKAKVPCFFIHGTNDTTVPFSHGKSNFEACTSKKEFAFLEGVEHALCYYEGYPDLEARIVSFIENSILNM